MASASLKSGAVELAHPVCAMFPMLNEQSESYKALRFSISRNGQWQPIVLDSKGRVLDGRTRMRICRELGIEPKTINFSNLALGTNEEGAPITEDEFAFDQNFARRDLSPDQRVAIYAMYDEFIAHGARGGQQGNRNAAKTNMTDRSSSFSSKKPAPTKRRKLASKAKVSERKAQQALDVARASPELSAQVRSGHLTLVEAHKAVKPEHHAQKAATSLPSIDKQVDAAMRFLNKLADELDGSDRSRFYRSVADKIGEIL